MTTTTATALLSGYRGSKVHAVNVETARNRALAKAGEAVALCGWGVVVGDVPFVDMGSIACRTCTKASGAA